ncbi:MAG TPA: amidase [Actinomycetota bacterium]|nr:amidase [Actinomycetota bacterium]
MDDRELAFAPALTQARLVREKEVSPVELVELYLRRIEELNPGLNAYLTVCADEAMADARDRESRLGEGDLPPFWGVPISIKDLNETAGVRTTFGCAAYSGYVPAHDDAVVARTKRAGFVMLGKTNTPEFGTTPWTEPPAYGPARNPWDTDRTTGGSSGGAGGALAAGLCPIAQGSDGGGSIRIPSSACGVYGIKPSRGRVSAAPKHSSLLTQNGPMARTVADAAAYLDVLAGYETGDAWTAPPPSRPFAEEVGADPGRLRVAFSTTPPADVPVSPGNVEAVHRAVALLEERGHEVVEASPAFSDDLLRDFLLIWYVGRAEEREDMPPPEVLDPVNAALVELGRETSAPDFRFAWHRVERDVRRVVSFFDDFDVLVTPVCATPPPTHGQYRDPDNPLVEFFSAVNFVPFNAAWNTTGQPAVSLPLHTDEHGLPVGVQVVGRPFDEATLIRVSAQLEQAAPWADRRPPVS